MKIGFVSLWWLPVHGGSEIYIDRLSCALLKAGADVCAVTGSSASEHQLENGRFPVDRVGDTPSPTDFLTLYKYFESSKFEEWVDAVIEWAIAKGITHVIVNHPYPNLSNCGLLDRLKHSGLRVGVCVQVLNWVQSVDSTTSEEEDYLEKTDIFQYDFIVANSETVASMISLISKTPIVIVHPFLDLEPLLNPIPLKQVTVSMVNPIPLKGGVTMAGVINGAPADWTFRVLRGGWGDTGDWFCGLLNDSTQKRIEFVSRIPSVSMKSFYSSSDVFLFPSLCETYGLAAVEAVQTGTPVVASSLPAVLEGVGDAAVLVHPHEDASQWTAAISSTIENLGSWQFKLQKRRELLVQRQAQELRNLLSFLEQL